MHYTARVLSIVTANSFFWLKYPFKVNRTICGGVIAEKRVLDLDL